MSSFSQSSISEVDFFYVNQFISYFEVLEKCLNFTQIYLYFSGVKSIFETMAASPGSYSQEDIQKLKKDYGVK